VEPPIALTGLSHLDLSVSDRHASARWYADVLGFEIRGDRYSDAARLHWMHLVHPCGLSIGLVEHSGPSLEPFDERRAGLDHVSFAVDSVEEVERVARLARELGYGDPAIAETERAVLVVMRDPDRIPIEVCCWTSRA
jgi:catechol 2,3-dioxygenase-like lactoylglutathione lyase family enzyme